LESARSSKPAITPLTPAWSTDFGKAQPMTFKKFALNEGVPPLAQLSVVPDPDGSGFLAGAFEADVFKDGNGRSFVRAWKADNPEGPWQIVMDGTQPRNVAIFQQRTQDQIAYDARIPQLPGAAGWTVVYSANATENQVHDFTLYRGQFDGPTGFPP
jgi:hypothetical protein